MIIIIIYTHFTVSPISTVKYTFQLARTLYSRRSEATAYLVGFKCVVGFYEFGLAGWERDARTCKRTLS
jgi:hypothetical protein